MKQLFILGFLFMLHNSYAQYLNGNTFEYKTANDGIIEVYDKNNNICEIDLQNKKIVNDFYWFENGIIYEIDIDTEQEIGIYSKNEITIYNETFTLEKPVFAKMKLFKKTDSNFLIKISSNSKRIQIEEIGNSQAADVLKLWLLMKGTERVEKRNNNATFFIESIQVGSSF